MLGWQMIRLLMMEGDVRPPLSLIGQDLSMSVSLHGIYHWDCLTTEISTGDIWLFGKRLMLSVSWVGLNYI